MMHIPSRFHGTQPVPREHRSGFRHLYPDLAGYDLVLNAALLLGSLLGPTIARAPGLPLALAVSALLPLLTAIGIPLWAWH
jgi:hypothetical protein